MKKMMLLMVIALMTVTSMVVMAGCKLSLIHISEPTRPY